MPWGYVEELLAQLIEEVSVLTADRRRKEPREVRRPDSEGEQPQRKGRVDKPGGGVILRGHRAFLEYAIERQSGVPA